MSDTLYIDDALFARMERAVLKVEERMRRASSGLGQAGIPFAVVGGNAIAAWVGSVDEAEMRNTRDVDIMVRRGDFERVKQALTEAGFFYRRAAGIDLFLDEENGKAADGVHIVYAGEMVRPHEPAANPDVSDVETVRGVPALALLPLVQIKLTAFRRKDQVHLLDLIRVGLVDETWLSRLPAPLADRLQELLNDPDG
ncbi:hypothetical protein EON82_02430 [bacterium]|nr:MAG: hypothetical protein EON82_02430 [bacterium]